MISGHVLTIASPDDWDDMSRDVNAACHPRTCPLFVQSEGSMVVQGVEVQVRVQQGAGRQHGEDPPVEDRPQGEASSY